MDEAQISSIFLFNHNVSEATVKYIKFFKDCSPFFHHYLNGCIIIMDKWETTLMKTNKSSFINQLIPGDSIPLWIFLTIALPVSLIVLSSLSVPILDWVDETLSTFSPDKIQGTISAPSIPILSILISIIGISVSLLLFGIIQTKYINNWYIANDKRNIYKQPDSAKSIKKLFSWNVYRFFYISYPIIGMTLISFFLLFLSIRYFYLLSKFSAINLDLTISAGIFVAITTGLFWVLSVILTLWNTITTAFGSTIAVTEPNVSNYLIKNRSRRFSFLTMGAIVSYALYAVFMCALFLEIAYIVVFPEVISFKTIPIIIIVQLINIAFFALIGKSITGSYYKSLIIQNAKISIKKNNTNFNNEGLKENKPNNFYSSNI